MRAVELDVNIRDESGKNQSRRLRRNDMIPAIVYGGTKNLPLKIESRKFTPIYKLSKHHNVLVNLKIKDGNEELNIETIIKNMQIDPVKREILHIDFYELTKGKKVTSNVPVELRGTAKGVKEGGIIEHLLREVHIECLPKDMPECIDVDISNLDMGDSLKISDLNFDENIRILDNPNQTIITIISPSKYEEPEKPEEVEEAVEEEEAKEEEVKKEEVKKEEVKKEEKPEKAEKGKKTPEKKKET